MKIIVYRFYNTEIKKEKILINNFLIKEFYETKSEKYLLTSFLATFLS